MATSAHIDRDVAEIKSWWRGELAAVQTYAQAIELVAESPLLRTTLQQAQMSHQRRCSRLERVLHELGVKSDKSSGIWGDFARLVEGGARLLGFPAAISALAAGEAHGLRVYQDALDSKGLSAQVRNLVACDLMQEQRATATCLIQLVSSTSRSGRASILRDSPHP